MVDSMGTIAYDYCFPLVLHMKIASVEAVILRDPRTFEESVLISIHTDEGLVGYGEVHANPTAVKAVIESRSVDEYGWDVGIQSILIGADPSDPRAIWVKMRENTFWSCRSGIGHVALAGVDMALWDLAGKISDVPSWQLMGEQSNTSLIPYATLYHGPGSFYETLSRTLEAVEEILNLGFTALKIESLPTNVPSDYDTIEMVRRTRETVGPKYPLLLDMGYRWADYNKAERVVKELDQFKLFALEAPFPPHMLRDYVRLSETIATPLATGDQLTAASDYQSLIDCGALSFIQAGAARTGISDMHTLAQTAAKNNINFVPWGWVPSLLSTSANIHASIAHKNIPLIELRVSSLYPEATLYANLATPEPLLIDGVIQLPSAPGLGVEINLELVAKLRVG